jgi:hypothetical protein
MKILKEAGQQIKPSVWFKQEGDLFIYTINPMSVKLRIIIGLISVMISGITGYVMAELFKNNLFEKYSINFEPSWAGIIIFGIILLFSTKIIGNKSMPKRLIIDTKQKLIRSDSGKDLELSDIAIIEAHVNDSTPYITYTLNNQERYTFIDGVTPLQSRAFKDIATFLWEEIQRLR